LLRLNCSPWILFDTIRYRFYGECIVLKGSLCCHHIFADMFETKERWLEASYGCNQVSQIRYGRTKSGADAINKFTPSLGIPDLGD